MYKRQEVDLVSKIRAEIRDWCLVKYFVFDLCKDRLGDKITGRVYLAQLIKRLLFFIKEFDSCYESGSFNKTA